MRLLRLICSISLLYCTLADRKSSSVLENIKKRYPNRVFNVLTPGDFHEYIAVGKIDGDPNYTIARLNVNESYNAKKKDVGVPNNMPYPLVYFPAKAGDAEYGNILYEVANSKKIKIFNSATGRVCGWDIPTWPDIRNRPHVYLMGKNYLSLGPEDAVRLDTLNCSHSGQSLPVVKVRDIPDSELSKKIKDMVPKCWSNRTDDVYCVNDIDIDQTIQVPRANPIYHTDNLTVYGFCCDANNKCDGDGGDRCSYFIYDHYNGADWYIDDDSDWTTDSVKKPYFLIPYIYKNDKFQNVTRRHASTPTPTVVTTPAPGCGYCCNFFFFFAGFFGGNSGN
ncbi:unnamed protein product [Bursaphelenchus xylophilus]|uniref:(pine wood nematode) hypothetical protein n=1 Tax=Bursaphelenchus xylophilus TaxID=6326 RepID=A0A1I7SAY3_BURXY|nr:unnamed protein product [Bursaphelenchus xylophilus]CAG9106061.1 unnamed protein product [Bursaphelenchus xylophilus]